MRVSEDSQGEWKSERRERARQTEGQTDRKRTKANRPWIFFPLRYNGKAREENEFLLGTRIV